ncbi:MAG: methyltransferase domain-containing protein, partial [Candidatus Tectomicrobia bacterium]|nr:methyltransferase domain-containing protein [Candidatus Tectomicrobia bacterium]
MLTADSVVKIYDRWGRCYDIAFKWIFSEGRNVGAELLDLKAGERLLEVGVGTGLSLPLYRRDSRIVGIDISSKMLEKAQEKVGNLGLRNVDLQVMDAQAMTFP